MDAEYSKKLEKGIDNMSINRVMLTGRLTREPEPRYTAGNTLMVTLNLAVDDGYGDKRKSYFFNAVAWRVTAEYIVRNAHKGDLVAITGKLQERQWEKDGQRKFRTEIVIDDIVFHTKRPDEQVIPAEEMPEINDIFPTEE